MKKNKKDLSTEQVPSSEPHAEDHKDPAADPVSEEYAPVDIDLE